MSEEIIIEVVGSKATSLGIPAYRYSCFCDSSPVMFGGGMTKHLMDSHGLDKVKAYEIIDKAFREANNNLRHK